MKKTNTTKRPDHYQGTQSFDVIDFNKAYDLNFNLGNVVKYVARAGKKGSTLDDLKRAQDYINREIEQCEAERQIALDKLKEMAMPVIEQICTELSPEIKKLMNSIPTTPVFDWIQFQKDLKESTHCNSCGHETESFAVRKEIKCKRCQAPK